MKGLFKFISLDKLIIFQTVQPIALKGTFVNCSKT